jgi:hypothetical protein
MSRIAFLIAVCISWSVLSANAQLVDGIIGVKRTKVQQLLRPYHILDYQKDRVVYAFSKGVRQTVVYQNDTCKGFFWAVNPEQLGAFISTMQKSGYQMDADSTFTKGGIWVLTERLDSGKATLFTAMQDKATAIAANNLLANDAAGRPDMKRKGPVYVELPLMQQEVLAEKRDTIRVAKDPTRNWVGGTSTSVNILGWDK